MEFSEDGEFLGYLDFTPRDLAVLKFEAIAEYGYFLAGEVSERDLVSFQRGATTLELMYEIRRDFDLIQINGYTFSSFGEPAGLPENLVLAEYEGDVGMYLVQFKAPMKTTWWRALGATGEVVGYIPQNTYIVRAKKADLPVLRLVNGVQHVSLYQPAYKVRRSLLTRDEEVEVDIEFDGDQDLTLIRELIQNLIGEDVDPGRIGRFGYARLRAALANRAAILRRPEVTWVEPALRIEFSGERGATVVAGLNDGLNPPQAPSRYSGGYRGHQSWLRSKGFCIPSIDDDGQCMAYWTKVAVVDSGLDKITCADANYLRDSTGKPTGECPNPDNRRIHWDLNHQANHGDNCGTGLQLGLTLDPFGECSLPVVTETYFCSGEDVLNPPNPTTRNHCWLEGPGKYSFSDLAYGYDGHGTAVASIIAGDPWSVDVSEEDLNPLVPADQSTLIDGEEYLRGIGIAPSSRIIVASVKRIPPDPSGNDLTNEEFADLIAATRTEGARFANNSWNMDVGYPDDPNTHEDQYEYNLFSRIADFLVRHGNGGGGGHQHEMTIVFSAGNWDSYETTDDPHSFVTAPANAKNVITVGATRGYAHDPESTMAGMDPDEDCVFESDLPYTISEIAGFSLDDPADPDDGNLAGWHSRRGFIHEDGSNGLPRYKPDLVAPGTHLSAAHSRATESQPSPLYNCFGGTSGAAPAVTASAVLAETWYWHQISDPPKTDRPSPAMIKAMLIAHADDLADGKDRIDNSDLGHSPTLAQGWGRVNLDSLFQADPATKLEIVAFDQDHRDYTQGRPVDARRFTATGQSWFDRFVVDDPGKDVVVVMVYTDRMSWPGVTDLLVNDLDLSVTSLQASSQAFRKYWGNFFGSDGKSIPTGTLTLQDHTDANNTVEVIRFDPQALNQGLFSVFVRPPVLAKNSVPGLDENVPNQDFALYVWNAELVPDS